MATTSFQSDILPIFQTFQGAMMWRFDLTSYEQVKANALLVYRRITNADGAGYMPPPPYPSLTERQIRLFEQWIEAGMPP
jgi:hypothetical protein